MKQSSERKMIKDDLIEHIAKETGIIQTDVELILTKAIAIIRQRVGQGKEVHLRGFGVFKSRLRPRKIARNLKGPINGKRKNPEPLILPAAIVPHFKPSKKFLKAA